MQIMLYTRRGCHLCEVAGDVLAAAIPVRTAEIVACDVDGDPALQRLYGDRVPVLAVDGVVVLEGRFDERDVLRVVRQPVRGPASDPVDRAHRPGPPPT